MVQTEYNIEFAHIYADQNFGVEQERGISILKDFIKDLQKKKSFVTCILIDEFSPKELKLNEKNFINKVLSYNVPVDFVAYESKLRPLADKVIKEIPKSNLKTEIFDDREVLMLIKDGIKIGLKEKSGKATCALLITAWVLCRFGVYEIPKDGIKNLLKKTFEAKKLITILPEKYRESENKVLEILKSTKFKELIKDIEYKFF